VSVAAGRNMGARSGFVMCIITTLTLCSLAAAQTSTRPAESGEFENQPIRRVAGPTTGPTSRASASAAQTRSRQPAWIEVSRVGLALLTVLALIFFLRWIGKRLLPNAAGGRASGAVRVLSRSPVSTRQHVLLVQVGRRVLVVADNGTQMSPLSEITDADEITHLISQIGGSANSAIREALGSVLGVAQEQFDEKIETNGADDGPADEAVASTRGEIDGLMEKVRVLARQLGRSA